MEVEGDNKNSVMCQLADPEGTPLGPALYLSQNTGPEQLHLIVNNLLNNDEKMPYAFYISDQKLVKQLETYLQKNKVSVEKVLTIVYRPQAVFRIRPIIRCSETIAGHAGEVLTVSFSPDGRQLASGSGDKTVRFWDLNTQTPLKTCTGHRNSVLCVAWSPDGKHLVSGSKAGDLECWDPQTGKPSGGVCSSGPTPRFLRPCAEIKKSPPLKTGLKKTVSYKAQNFKGHKTYITSISWEPVHLRAPCRRFVSSSKDGDARIWDITTRKCVICLSGHTESVKCVKWGGEGFIYTCSRDQTIKVWETAEGTLLRTLKGHGHWINSLALSTDYVLRTGAFDHTLKQYQSPEEMKEMALERYNKMKGNGPERLVSGSDDFTMFLWKNPSSESEPTRLTGHRLGNDTFTLYALLPALHVRGVRTKIGFRFVLTPLNGEECRKSTGNLSFLQNACLYVLLLKKNCRLIQAVNHVLFSPDGQWVASASFDNSVKLWNGITGDFVFTFHGHVNAVYQISWSADSRFLLSCSKDSTLKVGDIQKRKLKDLPGHADEVFAIDWSPDGEKVASGGKDKVLKLWMG